MKRLKTLSIIIFLFFIAIITPEMVNAAEDIEITSIVVTDLVPPVAGAQGTPITGYKVTTVPEGAELTITSY